MDRESLAAAVSSPAGDKLHRVSILCRTLIVASDSGADEQRMVILTFEHKLTDRECFAALMRGEQIMIGEYSICRYLQESEATLMTDIPLCLTASVSCTLQAII